MAKKTNPDAASPAPSETARNPDSGSKDAAAKEGKKRGKQPARAPARGKKHRELLRSQKQRIDKEGPLPLPRAIELLKQMKRSKKLDETVEIHMWLGIDTSQNDQMVRGSVPLPHG